MANFQFVRKINSASKLKNQKRYAEALDLYKEAFDLANDDEIETTLFEITNLVLEISGENYGRVIQVLEALLSKKLVRDDNTNEELNDSIVIKKNKAIYRQIAQAQGTIGNLKEALNTYRRLRKEGDSNPIIDLEITHKIIACHFRLGEIQDMHFEFEKLAKIEKQYSQKFSISENQHFQALQKHPLVRLINSLSDDNNIFGSSGNEYTKKAMNPNYDMHFRNDFDITTPITEQEFEKAINSHPDKFILVYGMEDAKKYKNEKDKIVVKKSQNDNVTMYTCRAENIHIDLIVNYRKIDIYSLDYTIIANQVNTKTGQISDPLHNLCQQDVENDRLTMIGLESYELKEDHLKFLRAVKFLARGIELSPTLLFAMTKFKLNPDSTDEQIYKLCMAYEKLVSSQYDTILKAFDTYGFSKIRDKIFKLSLDAKINPDSKRIEYKNKGVILAEVASAPVHNCDDILNQFIQNCKDLEPRAKTLQPNTDNVKIRQLELQLAESNQAQVEQAKEISNLKIQQAIIDEKLQRINKDNANNINQLKSNGDKLEKDNTELNLENYKLKQTNTDLNTTITSIKKDSEKEKRKLSVDLSAALQSKDSKAEELLKSKNENKKLAEINKQLNKNISTLESQNSTYHDEMIRRDMQAKLFENVKSIYANKEIEFNKKIAILTEDNRKNTQTIARLEKNLKLSPNIKDTVKLIAPSKFSPMTTIAPSKLIAPILSNSTAQTIGTFQARNRNILPSSTSLDNNDQQQLIKKPPKKIKDKDKIAERKKLVNEENKLIREKEITQETIKKINTIVTQIVELPCEDKDIYRMHYTKLKIDFNMLADDLRKGSPEEQKWQQCNRLFEIADEDKLKQEIVEAQLFDNTSGSGSVSKTSNHARKTLN